MYNSSDVQEFLRDSFLHQNLKDNFKQGGGKFESGFDRWPN